MYFFIMTQFSFHDDDGSSRFVARDGADEESGALAYRRSEGRLTLVHTEVSPRLRGTGLAQQLVRFALRDAEQRGEFVVPNCGYVAAFLRKHREYEDRVHPIYRERLYAVGSSGPEGDGPSCEIPRRDQ